MQLGARWTVGAPPHRSVPPVLWAAVADVEASLTASEALGSWTLTWLEGRPRLALDGELRLTLDASGAPIQVQPGVQAAHPALPELEDEDDDDWLN